jgi:hypothetical protein
LSWFIAAQGHQTDPDCNDYLTSKWPGLIRPLVAGFHTPLTLVTLLGIVTVGRLVQPENASLPMLVTLVPIMTLARLVQRANAR